MNPDTDVTGDDELVKVTTAGLPAAPLHIPVPAAAIVAVEYWQVDWSGPALGLALTVISTVSLPQPLEAQ